MSKATCRGKIIVFGILFWYPLAGVTYQFLHYLIGLRRLGYDVYYVEDVSPWVYDPRINDVTPEASDNVEFAASILEAYGFAGKWAFAGAYPGGKTYGIQGDALTRLYREADAILNVTGQEVREHHLACERRVYVESDPFKMQVKASQGDPVTLAALAAHDTHFTFGENVGRAVCPLPTAGLNWLPTRQPVAMELWGWTPEAVDGVYGTITTWKNKNKDIVWNGDTYTWTKDREFERFLDLPRRRAVAFELATDVEDETRARLRGCGWRMASARAVSHDLDAYRDHIKASRAEFTVARDQYVRPHTGWFSDRSACYLAAGRPVITQDTGFGAALPTGAGLFPFATEEDIIEAVDVIEHDYGRASRAAYQVAVECFDSDVVLTSLMTRAGLF